MREGVEVRSACARARRAPNFSFARRPQDFRGGEMGGCMWRFLHLEVEWGSRGECGDGDGVLGREEWKWGYGFGMYK